MKYFFLSLTLLAQFAIVYQFKMWHELMEIVIILINCAFFGFLFRYGDKNIKPMLKDLGWGMLFGALSSSCALIVYMIFLSMKYYY